MSSGAREADARYLRQRRQEQQRAVNVPTMPLPIPPPPPKQSEADQSYEHRVWCSVQLMARKRLMSIDGSVMLSLQYPDGFVVVSFLKPLWTGRYTTIEAFRQGVTHVIDPHTRFAVQP